MPDTFFVCDFAGCVLPCIRGFGSCERCDHKFCLSHRGSPTHTCENPPLPEDEFRKKMYLEVNNLRAKINDSAVCKRASELNGGLKCEIDHPPPWGRGALMGGANYHARKRFSENGSVWLIRVPRVDGSVPQSIIDYLIRSEYATLKFLETTKVPAPRVFDYGIAGNENNTVGVSYIIMEEMTGQVWNSQGPSGNQFADDQDKERVWNGLADILVELRRHPFPKAGSLLPGLSPSKPVVSALASERFLVLSPYGPFSTAQEYYTSFVEQNMALIADGQLFTSFPVNAYLVFLFLKSKVQDLSPNVNDDFDTAEQFYLKHVDDKGDHLMVDDDLNIVGIIDSQMARVVPTSEAFGPSLVTADMGDIYDGVSSLTVHDQKLAHFSRAKGEDDLATIMGQNERLRRFFFGLDVDVPWDETLLLVRRIWDTFGIDRNTDWELWKSDMLERNIHDKRLKGILDRFGEGP